MREEQQSKCGFNKMNGKEYAYLECKGKAFWKNDCKIEKIFRNVAIFLGVIITIAIVIALKIDIICYASNSEQYELSDFIGRDYEDVADEIGGMSQTKYSMSWPYKDNTWLRLWGDDVKRINYIQVYEEWTLCGLRPDMSDYEMEKTLNEQGFTELWENVYYNENNRFVVLAERVNKQAAITLHEVDFGSHTDSQDLFTYIERPMGYALEMIPDLEGSIENGNVYYKKAGVEFIGRYADDVLEEDVIIEKIVISGNECSYSLYGVCPGDSRGTDQVPNFSEGGSGESLDPGGHLLLTIDSEAENPEISLSCRNYF